MTDTVIQGPWGAPARSGQSALSLEVARVKAKFKQLRHRDDDVFKDLAVKTWGYLAQAEKNGRRSGIIGYIIGGGSGNDGTARHRRRYSWDGESRDFKKFPISKNSDHWLGVLNRCAEALQRTEEDLLLEAFSGSRLRPVAAPSEFGAESWLQPFIDMMTRMEDRLCNRPDAIGLLDYISSAHLSFEDGRLVETDDPILPGFRTDVPELPDAISQLPSVGVSSNLVGGWTYSPGPYMGSEESEAWLRLLQACGARARIGSAHFNLLMLVRRGLCLIPEPGASRPRLALYKWPMVRLVETSQPKEIDDLSVNVPIPLGASSIVGEILQPYHTDFAPDSVELISFAPLGSAAFDAMAAEAFADLELLGVNTDDSCWDPMSSDDARNVDVVSDSPKSTVAAIIERNLLFADAAEVPELRLDRLMESKINEWADAVREHRARVENIVGPARKKLIASWSEKEPSGEKSGK